MVAKLRRLCLASLLVCGTVSASRGQLADQLPQNLEGVGVTENLNTRIPPDLRFQTSRGREIRLGQLFASNRPVVLTLNYASCPMLCKLQLHGLISSLAQLDWRAGDEFDFVSVSIDPLETSEQAAIAKQRYLTIYGAPDAATGFHFLTGDASAIRELADTVGFEYSYVKERREYAHAAVAIVCTPDGHVSRYLYGVDFAEQDLRLALLEASAGRFGSAFDQLLMFCFHYDAEAGRYAPAARNIMKLGAAATLAVLGVFVMPLWFRNGRRVRPSTGFDPEQRTPVPPALDPTGGLVLSDDEPATVGLTRGREDNFERKVGQAGNAAQPRKPMTAGQRLAHGLLPTGPLAAADSFWFPEPSSTIATEVDGVFNFILALCIIFFVVIVALMAWFVVRYHRRPGHVAQPSPSHNPRLEFAWSVIPGIVLAIIFYQGFTVFMAAARVPQEPYEIKVIAKMWAWSFVYPNGHIDSDLHVPVDRPVQLVMQSDDVIHSLYVPAFRLKTDVIPGRYMKMWFEANEPGTYPLLCAEYCGQKHSDMLASVVVHPPGEFDKWLEDAANFMDRMSPVEAGELLYRRRGCAQCHSVDGSARVGPTFRELFGSQHVMTDGDRITVDENYIRESILEPQKRVRAGYRPVMPTYQGQLKDDELSAIIDYIKSLK